MEQQNYKIDFQLHLKFSDRNLKDIYILKFRSMEQTFFFDDGLAYLV